MHSVLWPFSQQFFNSFIFFEIIYFHFAVLSFIVQFCHHNTFIPSAYWYSFSFLYHPHIKRTVIIVFFPFRTESHILRFCTFIVNSEFYTFYEIQKQKLCTSYAHFFVAVVLLHAHDLKTMHQDLQLDNTLTVKFIIFFFSQKLRVISF